MYTSCAPVPRFRLSLATADDRDMAARLRHAVYALEVGQHAARADGRLADALDARNVMLVARDGDRLAGFVTVTPPGGAYSVDKYVERDALPLVFDSGLYEVRLLTVAPAYRRSAAAALLMWAAFRWAAHRGATTLVALGRVGTTVGLYRRVGMEVVGPEVAAGAARYVVMAATVADGQVASDALAAVRERALAAADWQIDAPARDAAACYHGGAFFGAIGDAFDDLGRAEHVVGADVLDAWFDPAPGVLAALEGRLPFLLRTSPPTDCGGVRRAIAAARGVPYASVVPGAGSSDLIFRALLRWLTPASRVLLLDPTYGEYAHVVERVVGARAERLSVWDAPGYALDPDRLAERIADGRYDLVVVVNPNSPTGAHVPADALRAALDRAPIETRLWIDETYAAYTGETLEPWAAGRTNAVVCVSMSKAYALSGARAAYLVTSADVAAELLAITPPWVMSLPAQVAAVAALADPAYYAARIAETSSLRRALAASLAALPGVTGVHEGVANFVLVHLDAAGPDAETVRDRCRRAGVFVRALGTMTERPVRHTLRVAVRGAAENARITAALADAL